MRSAEIRKAFLDFFESKGHKIVPSAPIVVKNDPTLMFINSGMAPFKDIFLGNQPIKYPRVADTQKCLRVSGKHNDLEEVGVDTYHHTMFEMLGNWSFGDYFKKEAIEWSWELLTKVYGLEKDRLYVTVFEGDAKENLAFDQDSYNEWKKWIAEDRILKGNKKDNFWEMGDSGPCGPCSEIHIDLRSDEERKAKDGKQLVNESHPQVIEIWNNVFMEFERRADKSLVKLPKQHVDTGMGFERLCMAIQKKTSNYDTDVFQPIIQRIAQLTNKQYGKDEKIDIAMRVVADHIRAITFTIADGQMLSNTGAGYVIRRILRRAVRYYYTYLECDTPLMYKLVEVLCNEMGSFFPEIVKQQEFIETVIREEESSFLKTLANGIRRFAVIEEELGKSKNQVVPGHVAFELFDTYGFPLDLTRLMAAEKGFTIDEAGFNKEMDAQKNRARAAQASEQGDWFQFAQNDDRTEFVGYDTTESDAYLMRYRDVKQKDKEFFQLVLDKTPFYAESGGQVGDTGYLDFGGEKVEVFDTKKENDLIVHLVKKLPKDPEAGVKAVVNERRRNDIRKNHSATHLLQSALRQVLGNHVQQKGSLVHPDHLRFDFAHFAKMTDEEIAKVEQIVNEKIMENIALDEKRNVPIKDAEKMGATMLFGEKYGEFVRVITFDENYSRELCGGTHVRSTGEIGLFKIVSESSISAGVRRIEALTGRKALEFVDAKVNELKEITELFKGAKDVVQSVKNLQEQSAQLQKENEQLQDKLVGGLVKQYAKAVEAKGNVKLLTAKVNEVNSADALRKLGIGLVNEVKDGYVFLLSTTANGKQIVHLRVAPSVGIKAGDLLKELSTTIKGGGPADFVQASAANGSDVEELGAKLKSKFA